MYKYFSETLPIGCMGIRIGNALIPKGDPHRFLPSYTQVKEFCYPIESEKLTQPDWALRGHFQNMTWPKKPIFWADNQGLDILWVSAHPSQGNCGKDFKLPSFKWAYGYRDSRCTYLIQVTSAEYLPRGFPFTVNINTLPYEQESLESELYY